MRAIHTAFAAVMLLLPTACRAASPATGPTSAPSATVHVDAANFAFSTDYAAGWVAIKKEDTYALALVPAGHEKDTDRSQAASLDVEVPKLPTHIPGMIPIGSVANGYVDDLKKHYGTVTVDERIVCTLAGVSGRRVVSSMKNHDKAWRDIAVMVCRNDRVYILSADCAAEDFAKTKADFDGVVNAWKWK